MLPLKTQNCKQVEANQHWPRLQGQARLGDWVMTTVTGKSQGFTEPGARPSIQKCPRLLSSDQLSCKQKYKPGIARPCSFPLSWESRFLCEFSQILSFLKQWQPSQRKEEKKKKSLGEFINVQAKISFVTNQVQILRVFTPSLGSTQNFF